MAVLLCLAIAGCVSPNQASLPASTTDGPPAPPPQPPADAAPPTLDGGPPPDSRTDARPIPPPDGAPPPDARAGAPRLTVTPVAQDFGVVPVGDTVERSFTASNQGTDVATDVTWRLDGSDTGMFRLDPASCAGGLPVGATCKVVVRFAPTTAGTKAAMLVASAREGASATAALSGSGPPDGYQPRANRMFVTSAVYGGNLGGIAGADARCAASARAAGLSGTFVALLSTSTVNASSRLGESRGWQRIDGRPVADRQEDLFSQRTLYPLNVDEHGTLLAPRIFVWTGSNRDGTVDVPGTDWGPPPADTTNWWCSGGQAEWGVGMAIGNAFSIKCDQMSHLYCFETGGFAAVRPEPDPASRFRLAFITEGAWPAGGGLAGADAFCATEASAAALAGTFKALLRTAAQTAESRFDLGGRPWARVDGVPIVLKATDLAQPQLFASLSVTAKGSPLFQVVWRGNAMFSCRDWTSAAASEGAFAIGSANPLLDYDPGTPDTCDHSDYHLFCLQE